MSSVKFNNKDLPSFVRLVSREIAVLPDIDIVGKELPRQIGSSFLYTNLGKKKESLEFVLIPEKVDSVDSCGIKFAEWLRGDNFKPSKIVFADKADRYAMAQVNGSIAVSDLFIYGKLSVEFLYLDPLSYLNTPLNITGNTALNVTYSGEVSQPFLAVFTVPQASAKIELRSNRTTKKITLNGSFPANTKFQIDMNKKQIYVSGVLNMKVLSFDSEWFQLESGVNTLSVVSSGSNISGISLNVQSKIAFY